jgi:hypothetical protein
LTVVRSPHYTAEHRELSQRGAVRHHRNAHARTRGNTAHYVVSHLESFAPVSWSCSVSALSGLLGLHQELGPQRGARRSAGLLRRNSATKHAYPTYTFPVSMNLYALRSAAQPCERQCQSSATPMPVAWQCARNLIRGVHESVPYTMCRWLHYPPRWPLISSNRGAMRRSRPTAPWIAIQIRSGRFWLAIQVQLQGGSSLTTLSSAALALCEPHAPVRAIRRVW